mmetsp:Transcript_2042/g.4344  ORF Transcript_2042/g.4344 Transcript_2042/m.4344 type:complete len:231 (-) Transcript_2042:510-1202(-)
MRTGSLGRFDWNAPPPFFFPRALSPSLAISADGDSTDPALGLGAGSRAQVHGHHQTQIHAITALAIIAHVEFGKFLVGLPRLLEGGLRVRGAELHPPGTPVGQLDLPRPLGPPVAHPPSRLRARPKLLDHGLLFGGNVVLDLEDDPGAEDQAHQKLGPRAREREEEEGPRAEGPGNPAVPTRKAGAQGSGEYPGSRTADEKQHRKQRAKRVKPAHGGNVQKRPLDRISDR